jgi:hypothetical protein
MDALLRPQSIALVGASDTSRGGWAQRLFDNLALMGFPARLYLVNPNRAEVWGHKCYPGFAALPEPVDLALTVIPSTAVPAALEEGARHGLRCARLCGAIRRGRRRRGGGAGADASRSACALRLAHLRAQLHGRAVGSRKAVALSIGAHPRR